MTALFVLLTVTGCGVDTAADAPPTGATADSQAVEEKTPDLAEPFKTVDIGDDLTLEFAFLDAEHYDYCKKPDHLQIRLADSGQIIDDVQLNSSCRGPCTPEAQQRGEERLERRRQQVEAGELPSSKLDYNFTECLTFGYYAVEHVFTEPERPVVVVTSDVHAPHDESFRSAKLVTTGCGELIISDRLHNPRYPAYLEQFEEMKLQMLHDTDEMHFALEMNAQIADDTQGFKVRMEPVLELELDDESCEWIIERFSAEDDASPHPQPTP